MVDGAGRVQSSPGFFSPRLGRRSLRQRRHFFTAKISPGETIFPAGRNGRETKADYQTFPVVRVIRVRQMIEAVTAILGLFSAGVFVAHAVEAYRAS